MSECEQYRQMMSAMLDGELDARAEAALAEHLKTCADCAKLYAAFSAVSAALSDGLEEPPQSLSANVMAEVRRSAIRRKNRRLSGSVRGFIAAAACLAVIVAASLALRPATVAGSAASTYSAADSAGEAAESASQPAAAAAPEARVRTEPAAGETSGLTDEAGAANDAASGADNGLCGSALTRQEQSYELTGSGDWAALSALLAGKTAALSEEDIDAPPEYILTVDSGGGPYQMRIYVVGTELYYTDADGKLLLSGCSQAELDDFLSATK